MYLKKLSNSVLIRLLFTIIVINSWLNLQIGEFRSCFCTRKCIFNDRTKSFRRMPLCIYFSTYCCAPTPLNFFHFFLISRQTKVILHFLIWIKALILHHLYHYSHHISHQVKYFLYQKNWEERIALRSYHLRIPWAVACVGTIVSSMYFVDFTIF